ncbi:C-C motif chemokine 4-like [Gadus macrocephalus]|uniref:C-C motif chemokine 4-like n=1 Tax=Gadus macrocephalus TaxID=80720 RepID=UPI0028CB4324|nr:C-C motif chemokine 4-like [Gadus macrocephalus]
MKLGLVFFTLLAAWPGNVYSTHGPVQGCCLKVSRTKVPVNTIVDYRNQSTTICRIAAVVFTSKIGQKVRRICADPDGTWTRRAIKKVNEDRLRALQENEDNAGAANRASTESPTSTKGSSRPRRNNNKGRRNSRNRRRVCVLPKEPTLVA